MSDEEGLDFTRIFEEEAFGSRKATAQRLRAERRAGRTSKERMRRAKKTSSLNFRCSDETRNLAEALRKKHRCRLSEVLERAILALAEADGVEL